MISEYLILDYSDAETLKTFLDSTGVGYTLELTDHLTVRNNRTNRNRELPIYRVTYSSKGSNGQSNANRPG